MKLLSFLHVGAMFVPGNLFLLNQLFDIITPRPVIMASLMAQYLVPLSWSLNGNKCVITDVECRNDDIRLDEKKQKIIEKFPTATLFPLHFNDYLEPAFKCARMKYNDANMNMVMLGWHLLNYGMMWWMAI